MVAVADQSVEAQRCEVERVLQSDLFLRAPSLSHLLSYVCEKTFQGEGQQIKEYSIAVDVFGRQPSFDHESDSIVRVQANRLRKHLAIYYSSAGASHEIHISIPVGQYSPVFEAPKAEPIAKETTPPVRRVQTRWIVLGIAALVLTLAGILMTVIGKKPAAPLAEKPSLPAAISGPVGPPAGNEVYILAGNDKGYVDRAGKHWAADSYFKGGMPVHHSMQNVWRTLDPEIYRHSRQGEFAYDIPLNPGLYELRLHFVEGEYGAENHLGGGEGSRLMSVTANGKPLLANFDVVSDAGGSGTADVKVFTDVSPASDGRLHLNVSSVHGGRGMLSAIEILPGMRGRMRAMRMMMRDGSYYSNDSQWWRPDNYFFGGQMTMRVNSPSGTDDPELYEGERWGHFSYSVPVALGRYTIVLHFVERRFGTGNQINDAGSPQVDAGSVRVFNVFCNGKSLLKDFEILKESRGSQPLIKKFTGLEPNAQGKLNLEFVPVKDYATLSAMEILPE
jgi:malectin (di-glucose binding ER protein)